jgi:hypothetical protein
MTNFPIRISLGRQVTLYRGLVGSQRKDGSTIKLITRHFHWSKPRLACASKRPPMRDDLNKANLSLMTTSRPVDAGC